MAEVIRMPRLSDTMEEGNIVGWLKKVGDKVSPGDILAEVETDKATMELESFHDGYLLYISVKEGPVPVNDVLAVIGAKDEDYKKALEGSQDATPPSTQETKEPSKKEKALDDVDSTVKKEKAADEVDSPQKKEKAADEVDPLPKKETKTTEKQADVIDVAPPTNGNQNGPSTGDTRVKTSPLAKSIAAEAGVDLGTLKGTGDGGRIIKRDVESYVAASKEKTLKGSSPVQVQFGDVPLSQMRKTIARRLVESKFSAPHFYLTIKINMDHASAARKLINDQSGLKISFNDFIIKAVAVALKQHPFINASWMGDKIRINKDINIGVAVAVEEGLLVPVLFGADSMGMAQINSTVNELAEKARQKKLQPQEMQGNTFTVSNLGMFGIDEFTAIINPPDAAIMAIGTIADELSLSNGAVTSSKIMKVTLSCDHRVIDGATGARFLQTFKQLLENPVAMLV